MKSTQIDNPFCLFSRLELSKKEKILQEILIKNLYGAQDDIDIIIILYTISQYYYLRNLLNLSLLFIYSFL